MSEVGGFSRNCIEPIEVNVARGGILLGVLERTRWHASLMQRKLCDHKTCAQLTGFHVIRSVTYLMTLGGLQQKSKQETKNGPKAAQLREYSQTPLLSNGAAVRHSLRGRRPSVYHYLAGKALEY